MSVTATELEQICDEIGALALGAVVQKIVTPGDHAVVLQLYTSRAHDGGGARWLLVDADARFGRVCFLDDKPPGSGREPTAFGMQLRKELEGARLTGVLAVRGERACELGFTDGERRLALRVFLFGRASQLQLLLRDGDESRVAGSVGPARERHLALPPPRAQAEAPPAAGPPGTLSSQLAARYLALEAETRAREAETARLARWDAIIKALRRRRDALRGDVARADDAAQHRLYGDLLFAHLAEVPRGAASVTIANDFSDGAPLVVPLDPRRSPSENAQRHYHEAKRRTRSRATVTRRLGDTEAELARAEAGRAGGVPAPTSNQASPVRAGARKEERPPPYREFRSASGHAIWVGRGAERNDELTFRVAHGSDLWLHTRDVPGAHVIVPLRGAVLDEETLLDAATLAAHHSSQKSEAQVDVGYTLRKNVRKPPKSKPGLVTTSDLKTIRVRMDPARLARLLDPARD